MASYLPFTFFRPFSLVVSTLFMASSLSVFAADECDTTSQCKAIWGNSADDCLNSRSSNSICMCGDESCATVFASQPLENLPPTASFTEPSNGQVFVQGESMLVDVSAADADGSIDHVRLSLDGSFVRQENVTPYMWGDNGKDSILQNLSVGNHQLLAEITDNEGAVTTTSIVISVVSSATPVPTPVPTLAPTLEPTPEPTSVGNAKPAVSFVTPSNGSTIVVGDAVYIQVAASDSDGSISHVRLSLDGTFVRQENVSLYEWGDNGKDAILQSLPVGTHQFTAVAEDDEGASSSTTITLTVTSGATPTPTPVATPVGNAAPLVSFDNLSDGATLNVGDSLFVDVLASDTDGSIDNVRLSLDGTFIRQENVTPYEWGSNAADSALHSLTAGSHQLTAVATDNEGATTTYSIQLNLVDDLSNAGDCDISGVLEQWHPVEVLCTGPTASESDDSTFTDYRFNVTFNQGDTQLVVPGHFAADGNAADTGSNSGNKWRAYFSAPTTGTWNYSVSFREGSDIAVSNSAGSSVSGIDGANGSFAISASSASDIDMRSRGLLTHHDGERYLRFADGSIYIQGGLDSPENIFGYSEFDNTVKYDNTGSCKGILHDFDAHASDWNSGDPTWNGGKGKSLIGLVNYIASHGVNSIYIMMNTVSGDGCDAHPWTTYNSSGTVKSFDVSKLDQWERVLEHMTENGILIHAMTQETENDQLLNGGALGLERKLYYRELISRFAHHPALQWNLGEENTNTTAQRQDFSDFIRATDPYDHPIMMHTYPSDQSEYNGLLGHNTFDGPTIQVSGISNDASASGSGVYGIASDWLSESANAGKQWLITFSEASGSDAPTPYEDVTSLQRIYWMWASVMSGGGGFEWYLKNDGSGHAYDLAVEDLREFDQLWQQSGYLVSFFRDTLQGQYGLDLQSMNQDNGATSTSSDWVLSDPGNAYLIFLREGGSTNLTLPNSKTYRAIWFNPRTGQYTTGGTLVGSGSQSIGNPPSESSSDWVVLVVAESSNDLGDNYHPDIVYIADIAAEDILQSPGDNWSDSYSVGDRCYCESTFDHNVGGLVVDTAAGVMTAKEACDAIGAGPGSAGRPLYNDLQCGNGPANDAGDEDYCPGRVDLGKEGCVQIGPKWNFDGVSI